MSGYRTKDVVLGGAAVTVGASATASPLSNPFPIRDGLQSLIIDVTVTATTVAAGVTVIFQDQLPDGTWENKKSTTVADAFTGTKTQTYVVAVSGDQTHFPLRSMGRVVATTGAGDSISVSHVYITCAWGGQN